MPREILLPRISTNFVSGTIECWNKAVGDPIAKGDVVVEVSTDKAIVEVQAEFPGTLGKILVQAGSVDVKVNAAIGLVLLEGESETAVSEWELPSENDLDDRFSPPPAVIAHEQDAAAEPRRAHRRLRASPIARRIAAKSGIDLTVVEGSGPRGRVVLGDVEAEMAKKGVVRQDPWSASKLSTDELIGATDTRELAAPSVKPANNIRRLIAKRLTSSKRDIPHFYLSIDLQIDRLLDLRRQLNEFADAVERVSINDFFVKASAKALETVPDVNVAWVDENILQFNDTNVSIAVDSPKGLMTPVLRNASTKSLSQISHETKYLAERARIGKLLPDDFKDGRITISNLGMYGVRNFSAIINPPQACILAIGVGEDRAVVRDGEVVVAKLVECTLSVDHRAVDGALAAKYLQAVKRFSENPAVLIS